MFYFQHRCCRGGLGLLGVSQRYFMFGGEGVKIVPVDAVLTSGEPEGNQIAFFNPS
jgi:hypothetical protein